MSLRAHSVYFGGGTPSLVSAAHVGTMLAAIRRVFSVNPDAEITLEANPATADEEKMRAWHALGVNRLSIGVQAFDDAALKRLNRGHTAADAVEMFEQARRAEFANVNLDLIYGLPLQTLDDWRATLQRALELQPEHLSLYALRVEERTGLEHQIKRGVYPIPDDDLAADMYEMAEEMLAKAGYEQYEISNWARAVRARHSPDHNLAFDLDWNVPAKISKDQGLANASPLQSRHNLTYWLNEPYLGFGAGAHSYFGGERFSNVLSPIEYIQRVARGESVVAEREVIARDLEMAETMFLGLRLTQGIAAERFRARFGVEVRERYGRELMEPEKLGLVEQVDGFLRLTRRGRLVSNQVFWRFLP